MIFYEILTALVQLTGISSDSVERNRHKSQQIFSSSMMRFSVWFFFRLLEPLACWLPFGEIIHARRELEVKEENLKFYFTFYSGAFLDTHFGCCSLSNLFSLSWSRWKKWVGSMCACWISMLVFSAQLCRTFFLSFFTCLAAHWLINRLLVTSFILSLATMMIELCSIICLPRATILFCFAHNMYFSLSLDDDVTEFQLVIVSSAGLAFFHTQIIF